MTDAGGEQAEGEQLKPSVMRGTEAMYGYVVAAELAAVAALNLALTKGKGAPAHPPTLESAIGLAAAVGLVAVLQTRNRMVVGFAAIIAAFVVTLPKVPNTVQTYHLFALAIPVVYALVLASRQRKATLGQIRGKAPPAPKPAAERRQSRRAKRASVAPVGPTRNRRYTPPKAKRPRR